MRKSKQVKDWRWFDMKWYSMRQVAKELGMAVNTFKANYLEKFPPDRETAKYKGYTQASLDKIKQELGAN